MPISWPRRNPYNKRWFQTSVGRTMTMERYARVERLVNDWEPRLFAAGINISPALRAELTRLRQIATSGDVDWTLFPRWVKKL